MFVHKSEKDAEDGRAKLSLPDGDESFFSMTILVMIFDGPAPPKIGTREIAKKANRRA